MSNETKSIKIILLVAALMLSFAVLPLPYGYYTVLRLVVCGAAGYAAYRLKNNADHSKHFIPLVIVAILFNPLIPIFLAKLIWQPIDLAGAVYLFVLSKKL